MALVPFLERKRGDVVSKLDVSKYSLRALCADVPIGKSFVLPVLFSFSVIRSFMFPVSVVTSSTDKARRSEIRSQNVR